MDVCKVLEHLRVLIDKIQLLLFILLICSELVKEKLNMFILAPTNLSGIFGCG